MAKEEATVEMPETQKCECGNHDWHDKEWQKRYWMKRRHHRGGHGGDAVYTLGFIGALVYFIQHAATITDGLLGVLKAFVWPALVVYQILIKLKL